MYGEKKNRTLEGVQIELIFILIAADCTRVENCRPTEERS